MAFFASLRMTPSGTIESDLMGRALLTGNPRIDTVVTNSKSGPPPGERSQFSRLYWTQ
jgi:hypothetical protein